VIALLRYQAAILLRSHRWLFPLILYALLVAVSDEGAVPLSGGLDWSAAMLVPAVALLTRSMVTAEPDAARAVVAAAAGAGKAQLAALAVALGGGALLGLAGAGFELIASQPAPRPALAAVLGGGLAVAVVCLLVGSAAGALCNSPLLRHPAVTLLSTLTAVVIALAADISPAAAALRHTGAGAAAAGPHWPGLVPSVAAACLVTAAWAASAMAASRRLPACRVAPGGARAGSAVDRQCGGRHRDVGGTCMKEPSVLGIVLAGGAGTRLAPLTADRAKPAVPFGGVYRLIDFALSNLANAGIRRMCVLTQYKSHSLDRHITTTWRLTDLLGNYVTPVPAQQRLGPHWYTGSADAIYQSMNLINDDNPDLVVVVGADHVYRMDVRQVIAQHLEHGAGVTVAALPVSRQDAKAFGIVGVAGNGRTITSFLEKPANPPPLPDSPGESFASMGIYVFSTDVLKDALYRDAKNEDSRHDIGGNLIPMLVDDGQAQAYDFLTNEVPGATMRDAGYWRDVGSIDAYFDAHMDLRSVAPLFNLYNHEWPILTHMPSLPPAKFVHDNGDRVGRAIDSLVSNGVIVSGGLVRQSVLSPGVRVNSWARVECSVILHDVQVGRRAVVQNAIIDKNVIIPPGAQVGVDKEHDLKRGFVVSPGGITVVGKGQEVPLLWKAPLWKWP
jgi:glucose-1-phosphate adenylyltransferase